MMMFPLLKSSRIMLKCVFFEENSSFNMRSNPSWVISLNVVLLSFLRRREQKPVMPVSLSSAR